MKPIIIGMRGTRPGHELYPQPSGCTGNLLWRMLNARTGATHTDYVRAFDRRNLVVGDKYCPRRGRARAYEIACELRGTGCTVILLGGVVREAFNYALGSLPPLLIHPQEIGYVQWRQIPFPNGRSEFYKNTSNVKLVELLLETLYQPEKVAA